MSIKTNTEKFKKIIIKHLENADALEDVDDFGITMMASDLALYHNAKDECETDGGVQVTTNGYTQITGYFTVMEKCKTSFLKFSEKFGLSPAAREKLLKFKGVEKEKDGFDEL